MDHFQSQFHRYVTPSANSRQTQTKLSLIVIGAGLIGPRHAEHIFKRQDCDLFAIIDHSAKGPSVAQQFGTRLFTNLGHLFEYCDSNCIDYPTAAVIATPNHTHVPLGLELASRGIHLLMEKPLAPSPADCKTLMTYCESRNVKLLVGHHRRFNPYIIATKENLHKLGHLVAVQGTWTLCKPPSYFMEKPWRSSLELGGGTLLINLIHDLDLLQYLLGPIEKVYAELLTKQRTDLKGRDVDLLVDEGAALTLKFENGCCGTFICSDNVTSPFSFEAGTGENPTIPFNDSIAGFYRIFGSNGTLSVPDLKLYHQGTPFDSSNNSMMGNAQDSRSWLKPIICDQLKMSHEQQDTSALQTEDLMLSPSPSPNIKDSSPIHRLANQNNEKPKPFDLQLDHFINLLNGTETEVKCSGDDALRALLCIDAVLNSIKTGLPQYVEKVDSIDIDVELLSRYS